MRVKRLVPAVVGAVIASMIPWGSQSIAVASAMHCAAQADYDHDGYGDIAIGIPKRDIGTKANAGAISVIFGGMDGITWHDKFKHQNSKGLLGYAERDDQFGSALASADFDGDGYTDIAVGIPGEDKGKGAVQIIRGTAAPTGLTAANNWIATFPSRAAGDHFGKTLAVGDFDDNGFTDLVIGVPERSVSGHPAAGAVRVLYNAGGATTYLRAAGAQTWTQDSAGMAGDGADAYDRFGSALAVCDFNGDGTDDLAIGVSYEDQGGHANSGGVHVLYGSGSGLQTADDQYIGESVGSLPLSGSAEAGDRFGASLAAADFNGDGIGDLAIGAPREDVSGVSNVGQVHVVYGSNPGGLQTTSPVDQVFGQEAPIGIAEAGDEFGRALAAEDFNLDGYADLAIGAPMEDYNGIANVGEVDVVLGSASGINVSDNQRLRQGMAGVLGAGEKGDRFGWVLASGDFGGDKIGGRRVFDLAIGVPFENEGSRVDTGAVHVIPGSGGVSVVGPARLAMASPKLDWNPKKNDRYGAAIA